MSEKRMAVSLTVLEIQRQKWTGGILPPAAGIRVKHLRHAMQGKTMQNKREGYSNNSVICSVSLSGNFLISCFAP